jgi:hypothetical protein
MSDRFTSPRPTFQATSNQNAIESITPREKDTTPSASVVERLEAEGHAELAAMLAHAHVAAKENAVVIDGRPSTTRIPRGESFSRKWDKIDGNVEPTTSPSPKPTVKFQPSDVLDDATFIRRTRDSNVHTPEMQALFWANGGDRHMIAGLQYAQAFDNLRREKMRNLRPQPTTPAQPKEAAPTRGYTPGVPTMRDRQRRQQAESNRNKLVVNERWAGIRK